MTLYVDADACPVKEECIRAADRLKVPVKMVCNGGIRPSPHPLVETVFVTEGPDEADKWIAERAGRGDVVITGDIPLAAKCVEAGALVLKHNGEALTRGQYRQRARHPRPDGRPARRRPVPAGRRQGVFETGPRAVFLGTRPDAEGCGVKRFECKERDEADITDFGAPRSSLRLCRTRRWPKHFDNH